jgi:hypothetical protein
MRSRDEGIEATSRVVAGRAALATTLAAALLLGGCAWIGPLRQCQAPKGFQPPLSASELADPVALATAYGRLFDPDDKRPLQVLDARLTLARDWSLGKTRLTINFAAKDAGTLRLRGFMPQMPGGPIFDVQMADGRMTVVGGAGGKRAAYVGETGPQGSPFRRVLGVDPGDLWSIFTLGARVATEHWTARRHWRGVELTPADGREADGLERVELDRATGLPCSATWRRGRESWVVRYEAWDWHSEGAGDAAGRRRLVPTRVVARPSAQSIRLTLEMTPQDGYRFVDRVPERLFQPPRLAGLRVEPLERLEKVLAEP